MADPDHITTGRSPAFQFYANDFTTGTLTLSTEEVGAYILLLCHCWDKGFIPTELGLLSRIARLTPAKMRRAWAALAVKFVHSEDGFIQPRLERERQKQAEYRAEQKRKGRVSAAARAARATERQPNGNRGSIPVATERQPDTQPGGNSSVFVSSLQSSSSDFSQEQTASDARSKRPIFKGQRLVVFEWMLDDLRRLLGAHFDAFDLHEWFYQLDAQVTEAAIVIPQRDGGKWLQEQTTAEAIRRGLPVASAARKGQHVPRVEVVNERGEDWFTECQRLHNGACNGRSAHAVQLRLDERAKVRA